MKVLSVWTLRWDETCWEMCAAYKWLTLFSLRTQMCMQQAEKLIIYRNKVSAFTCTFSEWISTWKCHSHHQKRFCGSRTSIVQHWFIVANSLCKKTQKNKLASWKIRLHLWEQTVSCLPNSIIPKKIASQWSIMHSSFDCVVVFAQIRLMDYALCCQTLFNGWSLWWICVKKLPG